MARRGTLCGAWSFLPAATDTKTALPFPLCCKRHAFSLHVEERDKNRLQPGQNAENNWEELIPGTNYHKKTSILTKIYIYANYTKDDLRLALRHTTLVIHDFATDP